MKKEPIIVNVYLWGTCIGKLNWDFESIVLYSNLRMNIGNKIMIYALPHTLREPLCLRSFYGNKDKLYQGLPEFLADALPDNGGLPYLTNGSRIII